MWTLPGGVGEYLAMLACEPELPWTVVLGVRGQADKVGIRTQAAESEPVSRGETVPTERAEAVTGT